MSAGEHHDIKKEVKRYLLIFYALMVLTVVTVAVSYLHLEIREAIILALIIATVKASLVACFFMHLISEKKLIYIILSFTVFFFIALLLLPLKEAYNLPEGAEHIKIEKPKIGIGHHVS